jgi:PhnB protein
MNLPKGHQAVMPYLMLEGAMRFIDFTRSVFNASLTTDMHRLREDNETVMHSEIRIGGSTIMFTDATEQWTKQTANLFVYVENADDTYAKALASGATTIMELSDQSYGRTCGVKDPFGNTWWITSVNKPG